MFCLDDLLVNSYSLDKATIIIARMDAGYARGKKEGKYWMSMQPPSYK